jgi:hypothetical protein
MRRLSNNASAAVLGVVAGSLTPIFADGGSQY